MYEMSKSEIFICRKSLLRSKFLIESKLVKAKFILVLLFIFLFCGCSDRKYEIKNVKLGLVVQQYFKNADGINLPIEETIYELLDESGCIQISEADCSECVSTLIVTVKGEALLGHYNMGNCYTGSTVWGNILLVDSMIVDYNENSYNNLPGLRQSENTIFNNFRGTISPPVSFMWKMGNDYSPINAPFEEAFKKSDFIFRLGEIINIKYGNSFAITYWKSILSKTYDLGGQIACIEVLAALDNKQAADLFIPLLKKKNLLADYTIYGPIYFDNIIQLFVNMGDASKNGLIEVLKSNESSDILKSIATRALGKLKVKKSEETLMQLTRDGSLPLKVWSCYALCNLGNLNYLDTLLTEIDSLDSPYSDELLALTEITNYDFTALKYLIFKSDKNPKLYNILKKLTNKDYGDNKQKWLTWWENHPRRIISMAWYIEKDWEKMKQISSDRERLGESFLEWEENAINTITELQEYGMNVVKVNINTYEYINYCKLYSQKYFNETSRENFIKETMYRNKSH